MVETESAKAGVRPQVVHAVGLAYLTKRYRRLAAEEFAQLRQIIMKELQSYSKQAMEKKLRARTAGGGDPMRA